MTRMENHALSKNVQKRDIQTTWLIKFENQPN